MSLSMTLYTLLTNDSREDRKKICDMTEKIVDWDVNLNTFFCLQYAFQGLMEISHNKIELH